jgi:hypothetical protein
MSSHKTISRGTLYLSEVLRDSILLLDSWSVHRLRLGRGGAMP